MELQIQELVSSIKKEGIDAAKAEADRLLADAKKQAAEIVAQARDEAKQIEAKSKNEIEIMQNGAKVSIEHAERDAVLAFEKAVQAEFEKLLAADADKAVNDATLAKLILAAMAEESPANYAAEVAEVTTGLKGELAAAIRNGLELRISPDVRTGFRLAAKDGSGYFDCSDAEITEMLRPYFPELTL